MTEHEIIECLRAAAAEYGKHRSSRANAKVSVRGKDSISEKDRTQRGDDIYVVIESNGKNDNGKVLFGGKGLYSAYLAGVTNAGLLIKQPLRYLAMESVKKAGSNLRFTFADGASLTAWFGESADDTAALLADILQRIADVQEQQKTFGGFTAAEQAKALKLFRQAKKAFAEKDYATAASLLDAVTPYHLAKAEYMAAACRHAGLGKDKSNPEAKDLFERASQRGYGYATLQLACGGYVTNEKDPALLEKAAGEGNSTAAYYLAEHYFENAKTETEKDRAFAWYNKAWQLGEKAAAGGVGYCYETGFGTPPSDTEAVKWYEKLLPADSEAGAPADKHKGLAYIWLLTAASYLGNMANRAYRRGDYTECVRILEECLDVLEDENCYLYAECWFNGRGKKQNYEQAVAWYRKAMQSNPCPYEAVTRMGQCYENGWGVEKDLVQAIKFYCRACRFDAEAASCLIALGEKAEAAGDKDKAEQFYTLLAERGVAEGQYRLGKLYSDTGCSDSQVQALYASAAKRGSVNGMVAFADYLADSEEISTPDYMEAGKWYLQAIACGSSEAKPKLDAMRKHIAAEDEFIEAQHNFFGYRRNVDNRGVEGLTGEGSVAPDGLPLPNVRSEHLNGFFFTVLVPDPEKVADTIARESDADDVMAQEKAARPVEASGLPVGKPVKVRHIQIPRWLIPALLALLVLIVLVKAVTTVVELKEAHDSMIPYEAEEFNGHYYMLYDDALTWANSRYLCETKGGHLVTITSEEENEFVEKYVKKSKKAAVFIGLYSEGHMYDPIWKWVTGETFDFADWGDGEPNADNGGYEYYANISNGAWNDCLYKGGDTNCYLCEWDSDDITDKGPAYHEYNGHYYAFFKGCDSWDGARQEAEDMGGYLACVTDEEENNFLRGLGRRVNTYGAYIGLYNSGDNPADLQFSWVDGEPVEYVDWLDGQPDAGDDGAQLYAMYQDAGYWTDVDDEGTDWFVVEWDNEEDVDMDAV